MATMNTQGPAADRPCHCMVTGCCCCYQAFDFQDLIFCCNGGGDCICLRSSGCLAVGAPPKGCGMTTDKSKNECCKIGCYCCDFGVVQPEVLCTSASQCLCIQSVASLPFHVDYVPKCVCALYFIQCAPRCGCCVAPPPCEAIKLVKTAGPETVQSEPVINRG